MDGIGNQQPNSSDWAACDEESSNEPARDMAIARRECLARDAFHEGWLQVEGDSVGRSSRRDLPDVICAVENDQKYIGRSGAMALIPQGA
jgi:hypothetical protein